MQTNLMASAPPPTCSDAHPFGKQELGHQLLETVFWCVLFDPPFGHLVAFRNLATGREIWAFLLVPDGKADFVSTWHRGCLDCGADVVVFLVPEGEDTACVERQLKTAAFPEVLERTYVTTPAKLPELISAHCRTA
jgi:hypothetical protein